jgi:hypothetical protein
MNLKFWERKAKKESIKYKTTMPPESNGWADVVGSDGVAICTCYTNGLKKAQLIAAALNAYQRRRA